MKVLVIGLGSMGKRRAQLVKALEPACRVYGVDAREDRREEAAGLGIFPFASVDDALAAQPEIEAAFISTSPLSHAELIHICLQKDLHVFTEINLVQDQYEENTALARERGKVLFLSSTPLYRAEIGYIKDKVAEHAGPVNYIYHVGQYLPEWHPWENYTQFFVGDKRTNGCREVLAIELPWITETFGPVKAMHSVHDKNSGLLLNYDDNYFITLTHENGTKGVFCADVICPRAVRSLEVFAEQFYISWDGTPAGLQTYDGQNMASVALYDKVEHQDGYQATIVENAYVNEIRAFFDAIRSGSVPAYDMKKDEYVLGLIDRIEAG